MISDTERKTSTVRQVKNLNENGLQVIKNAKFFNDGCLAVSVFLRHTIIIKTWTSFQVKLFTLRYNALDSITVFPMQCVPSGEFELDTILRVN